MRYLRRTMFFLPEMSRVLRKFPLLVTIASGFGTIALSQTIDDVWVRCKGSDADQAVTACSSLIRLAGQPDSKVSDAFLYRGLANLKKNLPDRAIQDFDDAIHLKSENVLAIVGRARAYTAKNEFDHALADYDLAIRLQPAGDPNALFGRANIYREKGQLDLALIDFAQAISLKPDFADAFAARGSAYMAASQLDRAIEDFNQAIVLQPDSSAAFFLRANAWAAKSQYDRAIQDYDQSIRLKPFPGAYNNRGNTYKTKGDPEHAIADFTEFIRLQPSPAGYVGRGNSLIDLGQYDHAIEDFDQALNLQPGNPIILQCRGRARYFLNRWADAVVDLQTSLALRFDPYTMLWLHMAKVRASQDDSQTFAQQVSRMDSTKWPGPIGYLFLGRLTPVQALVAATNSDPVKEKGQRCEAEFYSGQYLLMQKDTPGALPHFKEARNICPPDFVEYGAAKIALQQLESPAPPPAQSR